MFSLIRDIQCNYVKTDIHLLFGSYYMFRLSSVRAVLSYRPVSMNKMCDGVLNRESAIQCLVSNLSSGYFSCLKSCLYMQYDCKRLELLISVYHSCEYIIKYSLFDCCEWDFNILLIVSNIVETVLL